MAVTTSETFSPVSGEDERRPLMTTKALLMMNLGFFGSNSASASPSRR